MSKNLFRVILAASLLPAVASAFAPVNVFSPDSSTLRMPYVRNKQFTFGLSGEYGRKSTGRNWDGKKSNILAMYDPDQEVVAAMRKPICKH